MLEPGTGGGVAGGGAGSQKVEQGGGDAVSVHHGKLLIQDRYMPLRLLIDIQIFHISTLPY